MLKASVGDLGRVAEVDQSLMLHIENSSDTERFKENALALFKHHFAVRAVVDACNHLRRDFSGSARRSQRCLKDPRAAEGS